MNAHGLGNTLQIVQELRVEFLATTGGGLGSFCGSVVGMGGRAHTMSIQGRNSGISPGRIPVNSRKKTTTNQWFAFSGRCTLRSGMPCFDLSLSMDQWGIQQNTTIGWLGGHKRPVQRRCVQGLPNPVHLVVCWHPGVLLPYQQPDEADGAQHRGHRHQDNRWQWRVAN